MDGSAEFQVHKMRENRLPARKFLRRELFDLGYILKGEAETEREGRARGGKNEEERGERGRREGGPRGWIDFWDNYGIIERVQN